MNSTIQTREDLRREKLRLKQEIAAYEQRIQQRIQAIENSLTPSHMAMNVLKKVTSPPDGMLGNSIRNMVGHLAYNSVFSGYSWPVRMLFTFLSKNVVGNFVQDKGPGYVSKIAEWWQNRKKEKAAALEKATS